MVALKKSDAEEWRNVVGLLTRMSQFIHEPGSWSGPILRGPDDERGIEWEAAEGPSRSEIKRAVGEWVWTEKIPVMTEQVYYFVQTRLFAALAFTTKLVIIPTGGHIATIIPFPPKSVQEVVVWFLTDWGDYHAFDSVHTTPV